MKSSPAFITSIAHPRSTSFRSLMIWLCSLERLSISFFREGNLLVCWAAIRVANTSFPPACLRSVFNLNTTNLPKSKQSSTMSLLLTCTATSVADCPIYNINIANIWLYRSCIIPNSLIYVQIHIVVKDIFLSINSPSCIYPRSWSIFAHMKYSVGLWCINMNMMVGHDIIIFTLLFNPMYTSSSTVSVTATVNQQWERRPGLGGPYRQTTQIKLKLLYFDGIVFHFYIKN